MNRIRMWLRVLFARGREDRELAREMESHIAMERDHLIRQGIAPDEADRQARVAFGGVQRHTEAVRDERGRRWLDNLTQDIRFAFRQYARTPWSTAVIVVMLTLGIGANAFLFTFVDHQLFDVGPGIERTSSLVRIRGVAFVQSGARNRLLAYDELETYRAKRDVFSAVGGLSDRDEATITPHEREPVAGGVQFVTSGYLALLGVRAALGNLLPADGDTPNAVQPSAFVSYRFWRLQLGGAPDVIGQRIQVGDAVLTIAGVAPPGFDAGATSSTPRVDAWLPLSAWALVRRDEDDRTRARFYGVARLADGVGLDRATAAAEWIAAGVGAAHPEWRMTSSADVVRMRAQNRDAHHFRGDERFMMIAMLAAITVLIAAVIGTNVSALMLARAVTRQREIGVRLSLGATRRRLIRQLLTESTVLAVAGGVGGLVVFAACLRVVNGLAPESHVTLVPWTIAATMLFAIGTGLLFGLSPALHATRTSVFDSLKGAGPAGTRATRAQRQLVVAQIALSQPLLVGLGILIATIIDANRDRTRTALDSRIVLLTLSAPSGTRSTNSEQGIRITEQVRAMLSEMPGVERVSATTGWRSGGTFEVEPDDAAGIPATSFVAKTYSLGPGYFDLMGESMLRGREFDRTDVLGAPLAIVIRSDDAQRFFGKADAVGRKLRCSQCGAQSEFTIVGVIGADAAGANVDGGVQFFVAAAQRLWFRDPTMLVRVRGDGAAMLNAVRARVREAFPNVPITNVTTRAAREAHVRRESALTAAAATGGGLIALFLAAIGLYAIVAFAVQQRTREIGIRIALGAQTTQVVRHFFRDGVIVSIIGCAIGLPASVFAIRGMSAVMPIDAPGAVGVATVIAIAVSLVAMLATWLPARKAATIDPIRTLRQE